MDKRTKTSGEYMPWFGLGWERALISVTIFGDENQHSLENPIFGSLLCQLQTVAPVGLARLGWLLRQAKPSLDDS